MSGPKLQDRLNNLGADNQPYRALENAISTNYTSSEQHSRTAINQSGMRQNHAVSNERSFNNQVGGGGVSKLSAVHLTNSSTISPKKQPRGATNPT